MTVPAERTAPLTQDILAMIAAVLPGLTFLNGNLTTISATLHEQDPARIDITVRPIDFFADGIEITTSIRVDSIRRVEPEPAAITAGAGI